jgi:hypothetical protein
VFGYCEFIKVGVIGMAKKVVKSIIKCGEVLCIETKEGFDDYIIYYGGITIWKDLSLNKQNSEFKQILGEEKDMVLEAYKSIYAFDETKKLQNG